MMHNTIRYIEQVMMIKRKQIGREFNITCQGIIRDNNKQHDELNVNFHEQTSVTCTALSTTSNECTNDKYISCTKLL